MTFSQKVKSVLTIIIIIIFMFYYAITVHKTFEISSILIRFSLLLGFFLQTAIIIIIQLWLYGIPFGKFIDWITGTPTGKEERDE